jgi:predicted acyltransferase
MAATLTAPGQLIEKTTTAPKRVLSVDVLRGFTIALMILVNDPGDWDHVFKQLDHAEWSGWTLTDLVFPTFLFVMGVSMVFSLQARTNRGDCRKMLTGHLFARTGKLLLLSFVLVYFPRMHWTRLRFYGVIPRIAVCSLLAGLVLVATMKLRRRVPVLIGIVAALLIGYWVLLRWVPVPGFGMPVRDVPLLDPVRNMTAWIDRCVVAFTQRWLHTGVLYKKTSDPEGLLSTLPSVATVLLGALTGMWLRAVPGAKAPASYATANVRAEARTYPESGGLSSRKKLLGLAGAGVASVLAGEIWSIWFPINKNLWTSSYVLLAAGIAALALAGVSWLVDGREEPWPRWLRVSTWPWFVFGSNAIVAYTTSVVLVKGLIYFKLTDADGYKHSVWAWLYEQGFARHGSSYWTSLAFAVSL